MSTENYYLYEIENTFINLFANAKNLSERTNEKLETCTYKGIR
jgi:hypothetical protein